MDAGDRSHERYRFGIGARVSIKTRIATLLLAGGLLAGCAGRPVGVLAPVVETEPDASIVNMLVATTRAPAEDPGILFTGERGRYVAFTDFKVSIPPDQNRKIGEVQWPRRLPSNPRTDFATINVTPLDGQNVTRTWLKGHLTPSKRVLIFVHGFNNRFEDAVYRFAQITHDSEADVAPVLFTWPSRARVFDYLFDRESTVFSRDAFEETVWQIANDPEVKDVTIMAHSMGSYLAMEGLRQMAIRRGKLPPKIADVILASPDVDVDVFATQWRALNHPTTRFTVFVSQDDRALQVSRRIAGNVDRVGVINPQQYYAALEKSGITVVDLTALRSGDALNHGRFASSPEVVRLIGTRLVAGQTITDSEMSIGDKIGATAMGVGQSVGSAASVAISAPIAVFDPATRRTYRDQVNQFGQVIGSTTANPAQQ